ncbi:hypothetical protein KVV02_002068 [Mortierella alpina]|uniref:L-2-hydroxyglutarate dehydrogenase, mitochondrial n=1 Tax=Mortierella alpina TaxID=64518 RepID=A0A9P8AA93_MORAP|nr:hypothetical protein KVV02_002068 [Mortierella alpina]
MKSPFEFSRFTRTIGSSAHRLRPVVTAHGVSSGMKAFLSPLDPVKTRRIHTSDSSLSRVSGHTPETIEYEVDHLVIGAGVVGLAVAERLAARGSGSTLLVDKNPGTGQETSSRNSEVIHAGLYYPTDSLKTRLCIRGSEMMYDLCEKYNIGHHQTTKWVVGQNDEELTYLESLSKKAQGLLVPTKRMPGPPTFMLTRKQMLAQEPHVQGKAALVSPRTGIVDVHGLMQLLETRIQHHGGDLALQCEVTGLERLGPGGSKTADLKDASDHSTSGGAFRVTMNTPSGPVTVKAATVVNSAGLHADKIDNMLHTRSGAVKEFDRDVDDDASTLKPYKLHYCKGHYYGYSGPALVSRLIYPVPYKNLAGLGTHVTLDLAGRMRFGPDIEYIDRLDDYSMDPATVGSPLAMETVTKVIQTYLPAIKPSSLYADYAGIRPKLAGPGEPFRDFFIQQCSGYVSLGGIESPGLTSSLAIAEYVEDLLY